MHKSPPRLVNRDRAGCLHTSNFVSSWGSFQSTQGRGGIKPSHPSTATQEQRNPAGFRHWEKPLPLPTGLLRASMVISGDVPPQPPTWETEAALGSSGALPGALQQWKAAPEQASCKGFPSTCPLPAGFFLQDPRVNLPPLCPQTARQCPFCRAHQALVLLLKSCC